MQNEVGVNCFCNTMPDHNHIVHASVANVSFIDKSKEATDVHHDLIDHLINKEFHSFILEGRFAVSNRLIERERFAEDCDITSGKELFIFPKSEECEPFCMAIIKEGSSYRILLNEEAKKTDKFYKFATGFLSLLIENKQDIIQIIKQDDLDIKKATKKCIDLTSAINKLSEGCHSAEEARPLIKRPDPPGVKIKPQEGNCVVITKARSKDS